MLISDIPWGVHYRRHGWLEPNVWVAASHCTIVRIIDGTYSLYWNPDGQPYADNAIRAQGIGALEFQCLLYYLFPDGKLLTE
jgi:hypothetical protein